MRSVARFRGSLFTPAPCVVRTDDTLIAFRTSLDAGHAGAAGRFDRLREVALAYAFAIKVVSTAL